MVYIAINNQLYKVSDKDAKRIDDVPLLNGDELDIVLCEIEQKYKPIGNYISIYNINS